MRLALVASLIAGAAYAQPLTGCPNPNKTCSQVNGTSVYATFVDAGTVKATTGNITTVNSTTANDAVANVGFLDAGTALVTGVLSNLGNFSFGSGCLTDTAGAMVLGCGTTGGTNVDLSMGTNGDLSVGTGGHFKIPDAVGTSASGTGITANAASVVRNVVNKVTVINTALAAAGTSDVTLWTTPANTRIDRVVAEVTTVFTGGLLSAMTVVCGKTAGGNEYLLSGSVFAAQTTLGDVIAEIGAGLADATRADFGTVAAGVPGAITVQCRFTCTGANCNAATQGSVTFYVEGVVYP